MGAVDLFGNPIIDAITCCNCGVVFGMDRSYKELRKKDRAMFFCPSGHQQHFVGETETEKLKKQLEQAQAHSKYLEERNDSLKKTNAATRAWLSRTTNEKERLLNRIKNGVCPCCKRTFQNLKRHMAVKHRGTK